MSAHYEGLKKKGSLDSSDHDSDSDNETEMVFK